MVVVVVVVIMLLLRFDFLLVSITIVKSLLKVGTSVIINT